MWRNRQKEQKTEEIWPQKSSECLQPQQLAIGDSELKKFASETVSKKQHCIVKLVIFGKNTFSQQVFTQEGVTQIYGQWSPTEVAVFLLYGGVEPGRMLTIKNVSNPPVSTFNQANTSYTKHSCTRNCI